MKKLISLLLVLVMVLGLVACGGNAAPAATEAPKAEAPAAPAAPEAPADKEEKKDPVVLTMWALEVEGVSKVYQNWSDAVNAQYPWITIEYEPLTSDVLAEKFSVACATGTTPDIYIDGYSRIAPAVHAGLTIDLTDVVAANKDRFLGEQMDGVVDGKNYYVSYSDGAPYCLVANMTLLKECGVADMLPENMETWSYEEFLDLCRAAKAAKPDVIPTMLYAGSRSGDAWYYSWFLGNNAQITNDDLSAVVIKDGENQAKALEVLDLFSTMIAEDLVPDGAASLTDADAESMFCSGNMLFYPTAFNKVPQLYTLMQEGTCMEFEMDGVALPTVDGKEAPTTVSWGSTGLIGFANNGHEEEVKLAIDVWLKSPELRKAALTIRGGLNTMSDFTMDYATEGITATMARASDYAGRCANSSFGIREPWWSDFRETFYVQLQDYYVGNIDGKTLLENWQTAANAVITAANNK